jgi:hypothetical protein
MPNTSSNIPSSTASGNAKNNAGLVPIPINNMTTEYSRAVRVKMVHMLDFAETYNCELALLGTITVSPSTAMLSERIY